MIRRTKAVSVLVAGSRSIAAFDLAPYIPSDCGLIISGGTKGIDTVAERYAAAHGIESRVFRPDYARFGKAAPLKRNDEMVEQADMVLSIWDGKSRGTKHTIDYAEKLSKPVRTVTVTIDRG